MNLQREKTALRICWGQFFAVTHTIALAKNAMISLLAFSSKKMNQMMECIAGDRIGKRAAAAGLVFFICASVWFRYL
ncbi:MAG: hypothetical protein NC124_11610 [Clostridium sp.]|nr:hypothetical protein [Clostridium sp.]